MFQIVYNSNPQLSPPKKDVIPKVTEYQKQFKPFKLVPVPKEEQEIPKKKTKVSKWCFLITQQGPRL